MLCVADVIYRQKAEVFLTDKKIAFNSEVSLHLLKMLLIVDHTTILLESVHLMITPTLDLGVFVLTTIG